MCGAGVSEHPSPGNLPSGTGDAAISLLCWRREAKEVELRVNLNGRFRAKRFLGWLFILWPRNFLQEIRGISWLFPELRGEHNRAGTAASLATAGTVC